MIELCNAIQSHFSVLTLMGATVAFILFLGWTEHKGWSGW